MNYNSLCCFFIYLDLWVIFRLLQLQWGCIITIVSDYTLVIFSIWLRITRVKVFQRMVIEFSITLRPNEKSS